MVGVNTSTIFYMTGNSCGILSYKKITAFERCVARGEEVTALQSARAQSVRQDAHFLYQCAIINKNIERRFPYENSIEIFSTCTKNNE